MFVSDKESNIIVDGDLRRLLIGNIGVYASDNDDGPSFYSDHNIVFWFMALSAPSSKHAATASASSQRPVGSKYCDYMALVMPTLSNQDVLWTSGFFFLRPPSVATRQIVA